MAEVVVSSSEHDVEDVAASDIPESELVARVRRGDRAAFDSIMERHADVLLRIAYGYVKSVADAEDIVQEIFLSIWRARETWHPTSLGSYLALATRRRSLNVIKHRRVEERYADRAMDEAASDDDFGAVPSADVRLIAADDIATARRLVDELPERARMALFLRYNQQRSVGDVAAILEISVPAAKQLIWRSIERLRALYRA